MALNFQDDSFKLIDSDDTLNLYHSKDEKIKGIITDKNNTKLVGNFPVPIEYVLPEQSEKFLSEEKLPSVVFSAVEGTLMRVYNLDNKWLVSTNSRLDAEISFWSGKLSFGKQFEEYIVSISGKSFGEFLDSLDVSKKYFFILPTTGLNRIGKKWQPDESKIVYLVGVEYDGKFLYGRELLDMKFEHNCWSYLTEYNIDNYDMLLELVRDKNINLIWYEGDKIVKCISEDYNRRCLVRNNEQNLIYRYIQLLKEPEQKDVLEELKSMYPEFRFSLLVDRKINSIVNYIHTNYVARYIKKEYVLLPKTFFIVMKKCHQRYIDTKQKTTLQEVKKILFEQDTKLLVSMLRNLSWMK